MTTTELREAKLTQKIYKFTYQIQYNRINRYRYEKFNLGFNYGVMEPLDAIKQYLGLNLFLNARILESNKFKAQVESSSDFAKITIGATELK